MKIKRIIPAFLIALLVLCAFTAASLAAGGIDFIAELKTDDETWIPPKGIVNFTVVINNTGTVDIDRFDIITPDSKLVGKYGSLPAGESADVQIKPIDFLNPGEYPVSLFVVGYRGKDSWTVQTTEIIITVSKDPKPSAAPEPSPTAAASESQTAAAESAAAPASSGNSPETAAAGVNAAAESDMFIYIVISVLGVLALTVVVAVIVVAARRNKNSRKA